MNIQSISGWQGWGVLLAVATLLLVSGCASLGQPRPPAPTVEEIIKLSKEKVPPSEIIKRMEESGAIYRLKASELAKLREQGVADPVVDYMQQTYMEDVQRRSWMLYRDPVIYRGVGPYGIYRPFGWYGWGPYWW